MFMMTAYEFRRAPTYVILSEAKNLLFFSYQPMRNHFNLSNGNTSSINLFTCPG